MHASGSTRDAIAESLRDFNITTEACPWSVAHWLHSVFTNQQSSLKTKLVLYVFKIIYHVVRSYLAGSFLLSVQWSENTGCVGNRIQESLLKH